MAELSISGVHTDQYVPGVSIAERQTDFIWDMLFPMIPVKKDGGKVPHWRKEDWYRNRLEPKKSGKRAPIISPILDDDLTYKTTTYHGRVPLDPDVLSNADSELALEDSLGAYADEMRMQHAENLVATAAFSSGVWTTDTDQSGLGAARLWSASTNTAVADILSDIFTVRGLIGRMPNTMVFGVEAWYEGVLSNPVLISHFFGGGAQGPKIITPQMFIQAFPGIQRVLIGMSMTTTTKDGQTTITYSDVWGKHMLTAYVAPTPSLLTPSAGYTFAWRDRSRKWTDEGTECEFIQPEVAFDAKVTAADAGAFRYNLVS